MRIGIDIDDTITNTTQKVREYLNLYGNDYLKNNIDKIIRGFFDSDEIVNFFHKYSLSISNEVNVKRHAKEVIDKLRSEGNEIYIITARSDKYYIDAQKYCEDYLHFHGITFDKLITSKTYKINTCKENKIDIMFDDAIDTIEDLNKNGIKAVLFNSEINRNKNTNCDRVNSWLEVYDYIKNINKN